MRKELAVFGSYVFSVKNGNVLRTLMSLVFDMGAVALNIISPVIIVDKLVAIASNNAPLTELTPWLIGGASALVVAQVLPRVSRFFIDSVRTNVQKELTLSMVKKAYELELNQHLLSRTGEFSQALTKNYSTVDKGIPSLFGEVLPIWIENAAITGLLTRRLGPIGLTPLGLVLLYSIIAFLFEKGAFNGRIECDQENRRGYGVVLAALGKYLVAHQYGNVNHEINEVEKALIAYENKSRKMHFRDDFGHLVLSFLNGLGLTGSLALFYFFPPNGAFIGLEFGLFAYFIVRLTNRLESYPAAISELMTAIVDGRKITEYLSKVSSIQDVPNPIDTLPVATLQIEFRNVSFSYDNIVVLNNVSFTVQKGQRFAIVGPTGSGKSTILKLLLRLYVPDEGHIFINNIDINNIKADVLRDCFSIVSQESSLFEGTVKENINYGDLEADLQLVRQAATLAELSNDREARHDNTQGEILAKNVGQGGLLLSGGERQRVAIARSILHGGIACLLDEPTSSLDNLTTREVISTLEKLTSGITTLVISHQPQLVVNTNYIIYLNGGRILEEGTFQELMIKRGEFYRQLSSQAEVLGIDMNDYERLPAERDQRSVSHEFNAENMMMFWTRRRERHFQVGQEGLRVASSNESEIEPLLLSDSSQVYQMK